MTENTAASETGLPSLYELLIQRPLYAPVNDCDYQYLTDLRFRTIQFDTYCVRCLKETTFKTVSRTFVGEGFKIEAGVNGQFQVSLACLRCNYNYMFMFWLSNASLEKIGQRPAIADIINGDLVRFKGVLKDQFFRELSRANGLIAHGVGIGAFVYLRRIFEHLIADHFESSTVKNDTEIQFAKLRIDEKIEALKDVLPSALVQNKAMYSVLSTGIHSLSEEECKAYFPIVRAGIMQILEQDLSAKQRLEAERKLALEIAEAAGKLKTKFSK